MVGLHNTGANHRAAMLESACCGLPVHMTSRFYMDHRHPQSQQDARSSNDARLGGWKQLKTFPCLFVLPYGNDRSTHFDCSQSNQKDHFDLNNDQPVIFPWRSDRKQKPVRKVIPDSNTDLIKCKQCGAHFSCESGIPNKPCWCDELPRIIPIPDATDSCLCPTCLKTLIETRLKTDD